MEKPWYQRVITSYFPWILLGITLVGSLIDAIKNLELISPLVTYGGTFVIIVLLILLEIIFQKKEIYWTVETGERIRIKSLGIKNIIVGIGLIVALWIPRTLPEISSSSTVPLVTVVTVIPPAITIVVSNPNSIISTPNVFFDDRFDQKNLQAEWQWIDPANDSRYDLDNSSGNLIISTSDRNHNLYGVDNYDAPRLMLPITLDNFAIATRVKIPPGTNYQGAGLLFWQNEDNYIRLEYAHGYNRTGPHIWYRTNGDPQAFGDERDSPASVYLKIVRTGSTVRTFFSKDYINWNEIGSVIYLRADLPIWVGLALVNGTHGFSWSAEFDFFIIEEP